MKVHPAWLLVLSIFALSCSEREPSYESRFQDVITVHYPERHSAVGFEERKHHIEMDLRATQSGFVSGVMGGGSDIDYLSIDTDFDRVDEKALISRFVENGWIPADSRIEYERDPYSTRP